MKINIIKFLNCINNAAVLGNINIQVDFNTQILELTKILYSEGFIRSFFIKDTSIFIYLKYLYNKSIFKNIKIISKPSKMIYLKYKDLCLINKNLKFIVLSTDKKYLTLSDCKKQKIGGKVLFIH